MINPATRTLNIRGQVLDLSTPRVMGILNVTPDSFYDGNQHFSADAAMKHTEKMLAEGADMIDVGGYSSRPGATDISEEEETKRVLPVIEKMVKAFPNAVISIDTFRSNVARRALEAGASIVNDISGGDLDSHMLELVAQQQVPYIMMHMRGTPQTMKTLTQYNHLVKDVLDEFHPKLNRLKEMGVKDVVLDPGFGFAKTTDQNFELLNQLNLLLAAGKPLLVGVSRKSMIWRTLEITADEALNGTTVLNTIALVKGASILRVHDVKEARQCIALVTKLQVGIANFAE
ncbi:MAG: dihydropteroate synthase [Bacteroidota bacterium]